jgi:hypothetical protein
VVREVVRCWDRDLGCRARRLWKGRTMEEVEKIWLMERLVRGSDNVLAL